MAPPPVHFYFSHIVVQKAHALAIEKDTIQTRIVKYQLPQLGVRLAYV